MIVRGKTTQGFEYEIDERARKDRRVFQILLKMFKGTDEEKIEGSVAFASAILGSDQADKLEEFLRTQNGGYCTMDDINEAVGEIFRGSADYSETESNEAKN